RSAAGWPSAPDKRAANVVLPAQLLPMTTTRSREGPGAGTRHLLASDLAFDVGHHARSQRDDGQSLRVSRVWKVGPGLLFRLTLDVEDEGFMVRLADSEQHLAFGHAGTDEAAFSGIGGQAAWRCSGKKGSDKHLGDGHGLIP